MLVDPRHIKNVPGRKTDVQDCQWLQHVISNITGKTGMAITDAIVAGQ